MPKHSRTRRMAKNSSKQRAASPVIPSAKAIQVKAEPFAANLHARRAKKDSYDYLAVGSTTRATNALRPYCPYEKKDIGPEITKEGPPVPIRSRAQPLPERRPRTRSPEHDGDAQPCASPEDAQDVASYLITLEKNRSLLLRRCFFHDDRFEKTKGKSGFATSAAPMP